MLKVVEDNLEELKLIFKDNDNLRFWFKFDQLEYVDSKGKCISKYIRAEEFDYHYDESLKDTYNNNETLKMVIEKILEIISKAWR